MVNRRGIEQWYGGWHLLGPDVQCEEEIPVMQCLRLTEAAVLGIWRAGMQCSQHTLRTGSVAVQSLSQAVCCQRMSHLYVAQHLCLATSGTLLAGKNCCS